MAAKKAVAPKKTEKPASPTFTFGKKAEELANRKAEARAQRESATTVSGKESANKPVIPAGNIEQTPFAKTTAKAKGVSSLGKAIKKDTNSRVERMIAESPDPEAARRRVQAGNEIEEATVLKGGRNNPMFKSASLTQDRKNFTSRKEVNRVTGETQIMRGHEDEIPTMVHSSTASTANATGGRPRKASGGRGARGAGARETLNARATANDDPKVRFSKNKVITAAYRDTQKWTSHMSDPHPRALATANSLKTQIHNSLAGMDQDNDLKGLQVPCIGPDCKRTVPASSESLKCEGDCAHHTASSFAAHGIRPSAADSNVNGRGSVAATNKDTRMPSGNSVPWSSAEF
jgi:hypothetical protein